jgi:DNA-binding NarL/FixJ family response regulator
MDFEPEITGMQRPDVQSADPRIVVCASRPETMTLAALFEGAIGWDCRVTLDLEDLRSRLIASPCDVVVVSNHDCDETLANDIRRLQPHASVVVVGPHAGVDELTRAMRFGAVDFLAGSLGADEVEDRILRAADRSRESADRDRRLRRLDTIVRRIDEPSAPTPSGEVPAHSEGSLDRVAMRSEFRTLLRQELDVEDLLRTALEYMLVKTGPTNAAVFLAGGDGRFGLGAYVNYEHPRRTMEPMLQRLCDEACPRISNEPEILRFDDAAEFVQDCGLGPEVDADMEMVAVPCTHDGECLAVLYLFRNAAEPFAEAVASVLDDLRSLLAEQLDRLIRIHNRLDHAWPDEAEEADEDEGWNDLAA